MSSPMMGLNPQQTQQWANQFTQNLRSNGIDPSALGFLPQGQPASGPRPAASSQGSGGAPSAYGQPQASTRQPFGSYSPQQQGAGQQSMSPSDVWARNSALVSQINNTAANQQVGTYLGNDAPPAGWGQTNYNPQQMLQNAQQMLGQGYQNPFAPALQSVQQQSFPSQYAPQQAGKPDPQSDFPASWGQPPALSTSDIVNLPGGYGMGSSTMANWIQSNLDSNAGRSSQQGSQAVVGSGQAQPQQDSYGASTPYQHPSQQNPVMPPPLPPASQQQPWWQDTVLRPPAQPPAPEPPPQQRPTRTREDVKRIYQQRAEDARRRERQAASQASRSTSQRQAGSQASRRQVRPMAGSAGQAEASGWVRQLDGSYAPPGVALSSGRGRNRNAPRVTNWGSMSAAELANTRSPYLGGRWPTQRRP